MQRQIALRHTLFTLIGATIIACAGDASTGPQQPTPVASILVSPSPVTLVPGAATTLTATPKDANGIVLSGRAMQWTSSNQAVATVTAQGVVTGLTQGVATIRATSEGRTGTATVNVVSTPPSNEVASVDLDATTASLDEGDVKQFVATPRTGDGAPLTGLGMQWTSSDPAVATVSALGEVTAIRAGTATITVRVHEKTASAEVAVTAQYPFNLLYSAPDEGALTLFELDVRQSGVAPTRLLPPGAWGGEVRVSPDGSRIAFVGSVGTESGLFVMNRDGSELKRIVSLQNGPVLSPTWSPDGTKIAYQVLTTGSHSDIWVAFPSGAHPMNLTIDLGNTDQTTPSWSPMLPDGTSRIAFVHRADGVERIWTMRYDGALKREITTGVLDLQPSWSPNGQTIVYQRNTAVMDGEIWLVKATGGEERAVMPFFQLPGPQANPVFSPDGRMIAFASPHLAWGQGGEFQIFTVWLDGSKLAQRTTAGGWWPAWIAR